MLLLLSWLSLLSSKFDMRLVGGVGGVEGGEVAAGAGLVIGV